jgi:hypothetical protein
LLISRRPVEVRPENSAPELVSNEPAAPTLPMTALASAPKERVATLRNSVAQGPALEATTPERLVLAQPANTTQPATPTPQDTGTDKLMSGPPLPTVPAVPAVRSTPSTETVSLSADQRAERGYGHAPDYSWVRGVLGKHYHGHWDLRYCDPATEDTWGGKVRLGKDPRLEQFKEGDILLIEGEIVPDSRGNRGEWHHHPAYRIRSVQLLEHAGK